MAGAIYYLVAIIITAIALATRGVAWGFPAGVAVGILVGLGMSRLMSSMIILTEANAYGKRRNAETERRIRQATAADVRAVDQKKVRLQ